MERLTDKGPGCAPAGTIRPSGYEWAAWGGRGTRDLGTQDAGFLTER